MRALWVGLASLLLLTATVVGVEARQAVTAPHKTVKAAMVNGEFAFSPKVLTVKVGTKVTWSNTTQAPHTITGKGSWHFNHPLPSGGTVSFVFKKAGVYHYYCSIHPFMTAKVVVKK